MQTRKERSLLIAAKTTTELPALRSWLEVVQAPQPIGRTGSQIASADGFCCEKEGVSPHSPLYLCLGCNHHSPQRTIATTFMHALRCVGHSAFDVDSATAHPSAGQSERRHGHATELLFG